MVVMQPLQSKDMHPRKAGRKVLDRKKKASGEANTHLHANKINVIPLITRTCYSPVTSPMNSISSSYTAVDLWIFRADWTASLMVTKSYLTYQKATLYAE